MYSNTDYINAMRADIKQVDAKVVIDGKTYDSDSLVSVNPYYEGALLCSVMRCCKIELQFDESDNIDSDTAAGYKGKSVSSVQIGAKTSDNENYIYRDFGQYTVYSAEYQESTNSVTLVCYDQMLDSMKPYNLADYNVSRTTYEFLTDICTALGWKLADLSDTSFPNKTFSIPASALNYYSASDATDTDDEEESEENTQGSESTHTFRDALDDIAELVAGNLVFKDGVLNIVYPENAVINDKLVTVTADELTEITFEKQYGAVNKLILVDSANSNAVTSADSDDITANGEKQLSIVDNPLINSNRNGCVQAIFGRLKGLSYTPFTANAFSLGFLDFGDIINISDKKGNLHRSIVLTDSLMLSQTVNETFSAKSYQANSETEYSVATPVEKIRIDLKQLINKSAKFNSRLSEAQKSINRATTGHALLVDLECNADTNTYYTKEDGNADTFIASQYPAVKDENGNDWNTGRVVKINYNGIGVSTSGISGPYKDFAVYYDETQDKYCVNADDIAAGTLKGIRAELDEGTIGGFDIGTWTINDGSADIKHEGLKKTFNIGTQAKPNYITFAIDSTSGSSTENYIIQLFYSDKNGNATESTYAFAVGVNKPENPENPGNTVLECDTVVTSKLVLKGREEGNYLWNGTPMFMQEGQNVTLSENISDQTYGIVLVFSAYQNKTALNKDFREFFIPKEAVMKHPGGGHDFPMSTGGFDKIGCKYLLIDDNKITGYTSNNAKGSKNGVSYDNSYWVLRYVIGV